MPTIRNYKLLEPYTALLKILKPCSCEMISLIEQRRFNSTCFIYRSLFFQSWHAQAVANRGALSVLHRGQNLTSITPGINFQGVSKSSVSMPENLADRSKTIDSYCAWWHLELERSEDR